MLLLLFLWVAGAAVAADEPVKFQASGPEKVILDKPFQVSFSVNAKGKDFRLPEIKDFDVLAGPFESHSSSMSIINGERTSSVSYKYTYTLLAKGTGRFTIPSASIMVKNKKYTSNGLSIEVLPADAQQPSQQPGGLQGGGAAQGQGSDASISRDNLFIRTLVSKTKVYEQEAVLLTYRLYSTLAVVNAGVKKMPDFKGFMKNDLETQSQLTLENHNGRNYATADLYQTVLFPQRSGVAEVEPADFEVVIRIENTSPRRSIFDSFFDSYTNVSRDVTAPGVKIQVDALPTAGGDTSLLSSIRTGGGHLTDEDLKHMASVSGTNIRELESFCERCAGESFEREQEGRTLTGDDIDRIANEYFDAAHKKISVETVQKVVEDFYRVSHNDLIGPGPEIIIQDAETPHSDLIQLIELIHQLLFALFIARIRSRCDP